MGYGLWGLLVGAGFGMLFVLINTQEPLAAEAIVALRVFAVVALGVIVVLAVLLNGRASAPDGTTSVDNPRGFWLIVAAEAVLLAAGIAVLRALDAPEEANVAWIALVVGVHLVAFLFVWHASSIVVPGVILAVLGVAGLVMSATAAAAWTPFVSGVLSGLVLLAFSLAYAGYEFRQARTPG